MLTLGTCPENAVVAERLHTTDVGKDHCQWSLWCLGTPAPEGTNRTQEKQVSGWLWNRMGLHTVFVLVLPIFLFFLPPHLLFLPP